MANSNGDVFPGLNRQYITTQIQRIAGRVFAKGELVDQTIFTMAERLTKMTALWDGNLIQLADGGDTVTGPKQAKDGDVINVDTTAGPFTITLPAGGGSVIIQDVAGALRTNPVTLLGNGRTINGVLSDGILNRASSKIELFSVGSVWFWTVTGIGG